MNATWIVNVFDIMDTIMDQAEHRSQTLAHVPDVEVLTVADEARILAATQVRLIPIRRAALQPHAWFLDELDVREVRHTIETVNSPCAAMGVQQLHARTNVGFDLEDVAQEAFLSASCA